MTMKAREQLEGHAERHLRKKNPYYGLTSRELTVLDLAMAGKDDDEIARELGISLRTLRNKIQEYLIVEPDTLPRTGTAHAAALRRRSGQISPSAA